MPRKPFTVENQRPRRTINLFGRVLAPKGHGHNAQVDLSEDDLLSPACVRLFKAGRIALVRGTMPAELDAILNPPEEPEVEETPPPEHAETGEKGTADAEGTEEPSDVIPISEQDDSKPELEPGMKVDGTPLEEELPAEPETATPPDLEDTTYIWSEEELIALVASEQKTVCRSRGLKVGGKEAERVERILEDQNAGD